MVAESPGATVEGLAEQLIVGGSNSFTVKVVELFATCQGFSPSLPGFPSFTPQFTV